MAIKIERIVGPSIEQWQMAIEGMRLPMWSMDKSDSGVCFCPEFDREYIDIGKADMTLMRKLVKAGSDHRKFLRMLPVHMKITAPMVWLMQLDTYKVGTVSEGSSKMHKLMRKSFDFEDFGYGGVASKDIPGLIWSAVEDLNYLRGVFLDSEDPEEKQKAWDEAIDILPESYHQTRIWSANYEVLWSMYKARKGHKLGDWRTFCETIARDVPYFKEIFELDDDGSV